MLDYVLVVAVGISAGVGALVSAVPELQPYTLALCLAILGLITLVNLRGVRESGLAFAVPTYLFIVSLLAVLAIGIDQGGPGRRPARARVVPPPYRAAGRRRRRLWLLMRSFASGCTAMTGVEAVSNGIARLPRAAGPHARRTLTAIIVILAVMLAGHRLPMPGLRHRRDRARPARLRERPVAAGRRGRRPGVVLLRHHRLGAGVLALSANTGFADFPRLCRVIAQDGFLPNALRPPGPPAGLLARHPRPGGAVGRRC